MLLMEVDITSCCDVTYIWWTFEEYSESGNVIGGINRDHLVMLIPAVQIAAPLLLSQSSPVVTSWLDKFLKNVRDEENNLLRRQQGTRFI